MYHSMLYPCSFACTMLSKLLRKHGVCSIMSVGIYVRVVCLSVRYRIRSCCCEFQLSAASLVGPDPIILSIIVNSWTVYLMMWKTNRSATKYTKSHFRTRTNDRYTATDTGFTSRMLWKMYRSTSSGGITSSS